MNKKLFIMIGWSLACLFLVNIGWESIAYSEDTAVFEYHQKPINKVKEKNVKVRVAVSRFDEEVVIAESPFNIIDEEKSNAEEALIKIEDSDIEITFDGKEDEEKVTKGELLIGLIANELIATNLFEVIERREINDLIREISFQNSKWVKSNSANALGNIYDIQYIVTGDILRNKSGEKIDDSHYTVALRMFNVNTGKIVSSSVNSAIYLKDAISQAVSNLTKKVRGAPWTCKVVGVNNEGIYVNAGLDDDLEKRDGFYVYRIVGDIIDPETKETLGFNKKKIALIEISEVLENRLSLAKVTEAYGDIRVGDIVAAERIAKDKKSELELWKKIYNHGGISSNKADKYSLAVDGFTPEDIMSNFGQAVIKIQTEKAIGSGFIIDIEGHVVTNFHVIKGATTISAKMIERDKYFPNVQIIKTDSEKDIALLKINNANDLPTIKLGDSNKLVVGERVVAIGNPQGLENTISDGLVSGIRENQGIKIIQTSVPVTHGSSGGPLFNMQGEVVGVVTAGIQEGANLNFAVPINYVRDELLN